MSNFTISDADLRSIIKIEKETRSGQYICQCPFCKKDKHFYINKHTQLFDCKKCMVTGNIYKLLKYLDKTYLIGDKSVELSKTLQSIRQGIEEQQKEAGMTLAILPEVALPVGSKLIRKNEYLRSRKIGKREIERYRLQETKLSFKLQNYIIIPIFDNGVIRGWLGRYGSRKVPENRLRYNNSLNTEFAGLIYGYDELVEGKTETVIITEGVFDKFRIDQALELYNADEVKCVSTFGKKISKQQIQKLMRKQITNVILSWDYDALKEIRSFGFELDNYFNVGVAVCTMKKDFGECNQSEIIQIFSNVRSINDFSQGTIGKLKR